MCEFPYACHRRCLKFKFWKKKISKNCKKWTVDKIDISKKEGFYKFKDANFVLIKEDRVI